MAKPYVAVQRMNQKTDIMHYKYLKREKGPNGKYKYYYDKDQIKKDLGYDERDAMERQRSTALQTLAQYEFDELQYQRNTDPNKEKLLRKRYKRSSRKLDKDVKEFLNYKQEYLKTPLGKVEDAAAIGKGIVEKIAGIFK